MHRLCIEPHLSHSFEARWMELMASCVIRNGCLPCHRRRPLATLCFKLMRTPILRSPSYRRPISYISFSQDRPPASASLRIRDRGWAKVTRSLAPKDLWQSRGLCRLYKKRGLWAHFAISGFRWSKFQISGYVSIVYLKHVIRKESNHGGV